LKEVLQDLFKKKKYRNNSIMLICSLFLIFCAAEYFCSNSDTTFFDECKVIKKNQYFLINLMHAN